MMFQVIYKFEHVIEKGANIYQYAKVGDEVNVGDPLRVWQNPFDDAAANAAASLGYNVIKCYTEV